MKVLIYTVRALPPMLLFQPMHNKINVYSISGQINCGCPVQINPLI